VRRHARQLGLASALGLFALALACLAPDFFALGNLRSLALDNLPLLLAATGMTLVLLAGEIDVSIGAQFAAAGVLAGLLARLGLPIGLVALLVLALGTLFGALQGALVARGVPAVVVTLASLALLRGSLRWSTGGRWIDELPADFQWYGLGASGGQLASAFGVLGLVGLTALALWRLHAGRTLLAVGCDARAAHLAGVRVPRVRCAAFAAMGFFAAAAALVSVTRYPAVEIEAGAGLELAAIACAVLGGTSIRGGRGTILGTLLGVVLFGALGTALVFLGVGAAWERAVQGGVILAALVPEALARWRQGRRSQEQPA
jgi:rhamnose transport system permease protein